MKPRILFMADGITLAHVVRPLVLMRGLNPDEMDVVFASDPAYDWIVEKEKSRQSFEAISIHSMTTEKFLSHVTKGKPLIDEASLRSYVEEDLRIIDEVEPDMIVGDGRFSLAISAELKGISYAYLENAYWSPQSPLKMPVPDVAPLRRMGPVLGRFMFDLMKPLVFKKLASPMNEVRMDYGLPPLGSDLKRVYHTPSDFAFFCDLPDLFPIPELPTDHYFVGPIQWSPEVELPAWWEKVPENKPVVYVTLGSSGDATLFPTIVKTLSDMSVSVMVATAGRMKLEETPSNVFVADYLPGEACAKRADLVISNGGSLTTYQALAQGTPILGITHPLDQMLNMAGVQQAGVGIALRGSQLTSQTLQQAVEEILRNDSYKRTAAQLATKIKAWDPATFNTILKSLLK